MQIIGKDNLIINYRGCPGYDNFWINLDLFCSIKNDLEIEPKNVQAIPFKIRNVPKVVNCWYSYTKKMSMVLKRFIATKKHRVESPHVKMFQFLIQN